jgi:hypothetical protein
MTNCIFNLPYTTTVSALHRSVVQWRRSSQPDSEGANKSLGFFKRNLKTSNTNIKSQAYLSLVRPKLEYACSVWNPHTAELCNKIEMVQRRAARYACNIYHNTSSVTDMLQTLTWPTLQQHRLKTKLIMFYKIVHHIVAVPTTILIPTDPRIRQFHPFTYRHRYAFKDPYKYSFFPNTIIHWNLLPQTIVVLCPTVNTFREQPTPTVLSHLQSQI